MRHIAPSRLFGIVEGRIAFDDDEREHLDKCDECREVLAVFEGYIAKDAAEEKDRGV